MKEKLLIQTKSQIENFNLITDEDSLISWYLERIISLMPSNLKLEVKGQNPRLEIMLNLKDQTLFRFSYVSESKELINFLHKYYIIQI